LQVTHYPTASYFAYKSSQRESRCMIDASAYTELHSSGDISTPNASAEDNISNSTTSLDEDPAGDFLLLQPPTVFGFDMREHRWRNLLVRNIAPIVWHKNAFDSLALDADVKDALKAMTMRCNDEIHEDTSNKDDRLTLLFHGASGTGKTATCEAIAEVAERPLYRVTHTDIGKNVLSAERVFKSVLQIKPAWRCIVLLDDADVFLEQRSSRDLKHNGLISAFLQFLERYNGTLVLTSHRVGSFDGVLKSRIQFAVHLEKPTQQQRIRVWKNHANRLGKLTGYDDKASILSHIEELSEFELDGQQISNAIQTAQQLAAYRREYLRFEHLKFAIAASVKFEKWLTHGYGHTDDS
jgi:hypothetical protein